MSSSIIILKQELCVYTFPSYHVCGTLGCNLHAVLLLFLVKNLLEELECLVDDVYGITLTANFSALKVSDSHSIENKLTTESCIIGVEVSVPIFPFTKPLLSVFFSTENTLLFTMMR